MKTVLITGANKGIGFETARQMAQKGFFVYLGSRDKQRGEDAVVKLHNEGLTETEVIALDVTSEKSVSDAFDHLKKKTESLDVLINNAGIRGIVPQNASSVPVEQIMEIFNTNFFGAVRVTQAFLPLLQKSTAPHIVNVTSDLSSLSQHQDPDWRYFKFSPAGYAPSKSALNAYTIMLAKELRDTAFKINVVNPGHTATDFNNHQGHKKAEDAARILVVFTILSENGPSGKFFSEEGETPW